MKIVPGALLALVVPALVLGGFEYGKPRAPEITAGPFIAGRSLDEREVQLTIEITNNYGTPLWISFDHNVGGPEPIGGALAPRQLGASPTQFAFPTGWAGRIYVGKTINPANSKIEASYIGSPDVDVSYVDGYSVPITCSSQGVVVSGCNIPLFNAGNPCSDMDNNGPVCINPQVDVPYGPATPFFAPCQGAAYTYPKDDGANVGGVGTSINCCIGLSCPAPDRQYAKRDLEEREAEELLKLNFSSYNAGNRSPQRQPRAPIANGSALARLPGSVRIDPPAFTASSVSPSKASRTAKKTSPGKNVPKPSDDLDDPFAVSGPPSTKGGSEDCHDPSSQFTDLTQKSSVMTGDASERRHARDLGRKDDNVTT